MENKNYVLLMAPIEKGGYIGQINAVDNSTHIDKKRVERLINDGYTFVGRVSDCSLSAYRLKVGFAKYAEDRATILDDRLDLIAKVYKGDFDDYKEKATSDDNR